MNIDCPSKLQLMEPAGFLFDLGLLLIKIKVRIENIYMLFLCSGTSKLSV